MSEVESSRNKAAELAFAAGGIGFILAGAGLGAYVGYNSASDDVQSGYQAHAQKAAAIEKCIGFVGRNVISDPNGTPISLPLTDIPVDLQEGCGINPNDAAQANWFTSDGRESWGTRVYAPSNFLVSIDVKKLQAARQSQLKLSEYTSTPYEIVHKTEYAFFTATGAIVGSAIALLAIVGYAKLDDAARKKREVRTGSL